MNEQVRTIDYGQALPVAEQRNRVLRNTYWLLALSLVPTVLGAWLGVATGMMRGLGGGLGLIVFLGGAFGFMYAIEKTKNSAAGVPVLLAFTFFMGLMLSRLIAVVLGFKNGPSLVMTAFGGTAGVFFVMATLSSVIKRDISGMGKWLFAGAVVIMVGAIINVFVGSGIGMMVISTLAIGVFSLFMLYDLKRIIDGGETNYISATLALYLDIFNVFQSLLALLGTGRRQRLKPPGARAPASRKQGLRALFSFRLSPAPGQVEDRHAFHMRRVGKHVDHPGRHASVAGLVHQQARVSRERGGIAADIDDAPGRRPCPAQFRVLVQVRQRLDQRKSALPRRIDQPPVGTAVAQQLFGRHHEQVAGGKGRPGPAAAPAAAEALLRS